MMEREGESRSNCAILLFSDESKPTIEKGLEDVILDAVGLEARFDCTVLHGVGHEDHRGMVEEQSPPGCFR